MIGERKLTRFTGAVRLLLADGPRQVINALTLYSVGKAKLLDPGKGADRSGFDQFFYNLQKLGESDRTQTIILSTMAFTLVIWVISMLLLLLALILYIIFLWHYIQEDTLTGFCRRKVEARLARIVKKKSDKELARQQKKWEKAERQAERRGVSPTNSFASTLPLKLGKQPTLPMLGGSPPEKASLFRSDSTTTTSTLPLYTSQPTTPAGGQPPILQRIPTIPEMGPLGRPPLTRPDTSMSDVSVASDAPLLYQAASMGYDDPSRPGPMNRSLTGSTQRSFTPNSMQGRPSLPPLATQGAPGPRYPPPMRTNTGMSGRMSPMSASTNNNYTPLSSQSSRPLLSGQSPLSPYDNRTQSPAPLMTYEMTPVERGYGGGGGDYFSQGMPQRAPTVPPQDASTPSSLQIGRRDASAPMPQRQGPLPWPPTQRSATAPVPGYARGPVQRSATARPQGPPGW